MNWCYPELNMYAQIGMFSLSFHKELYDYYKSSITGMCDSPIEFDRMEEFYETLDRDHGPPDDKVIPSQVKVDWCRWAHEKTMNAGYDADSSHKWLLERDLDWKNIVRGIPPSVIRDRFESPDGLFPQKWPEPDGESEAQRESHVVAALIMDDYDNQTPSDLAYNQVSQAMNLQGRLLQASTVFGLQPEQVIEHVQQRGIEVNIQANERFARHVPADVTQQRMSREVLLSVSPSESDLQAIEHLGIQATTMHADIDPSQFPTVTEVSAPAFSGPAHKLTPETHDAAPSSASASQITENPETAAPKTMSLPKPKAAPAHLLRPEQPFSQYTSWTCQNPTQKYVPDGPTQMMLSQEPDWIAHQTVLCKSGPKPWYAPKDYGASTETAAHEPPVMLVIPPDVVAEVVNLDTFPTFDQWKDAMWHAPFVASHEAEVMTSYKPISYSIVGFDGP
eukprot:246025-Amphidinium_carterae.1